MLNLTSKIIFKRSQRLFSFKKDFLDHLIQKEKNLKVENDKSSQINLQNEVQKFQNQQKIQQDDPSVEYDLKKQENFLKNERKFQNFLDNYKTINEKLEEHILNCEDPVERQFRLESLIEQTKSGQLPSYLKNIHNKVDYLDQYNRYEFYEQNFITQVQNSDLRKEDEQKYWRRNEEQFLKQIINFFVKNLDPEIEKKTVEKKPLTLRAKMLRKIKEYEKKHIQVPGFIEGQFDGTLEPGNKIAIDTSGENEKQNFTVENENDNLQDFEDQFLQMLEKETAKHEKMKGFEKPVVDFEDLYFLDVDSIDNREQEIINAGDERQAHVYQFTLKAQLQIYELYLKGWKLRELSKRFGATPLKIKMVVYSFQNFFETVLPQVSLARACQLFYLEDQDVIYGQKRVDYGTDLPLLLDLEHGRVRSEFPRDSFRHILAPNKERNITEEDLMEFQLTVKKPLDKLVPENNTTQGKQPYLIQNWIPQKGKGSRKVSSAFKELIYRSHYKGYFTYKTEKKREKGPRYAAMGKGFLQMENSQIEIDQKLRNQLIKNNLFVNSRIMYGTSGFRFEAIALPFIAFRVGIFMGLYGKKFLNQALGLAITASHNPAKDNGLKIISSIGEMLDQKLESVLEDFVNEKDLKIGIQNLIQKLFNDKFQDFQDNQSIIIVGHDTRPSAQEIWTAFKKGADVYKSKSLYLGLTTTPQVYWYVVKYNELQKKGEQITIKFLKDQYIDQISNKAEEILELLNTGDQKKEIYVDCAGGIGSLPLSQFKQKFLDKYFDLKIINHMDNKDIILNKNIGAEHVHKKVKLPLNMPSQAKYCVSFDGDADRIIYYNILDYQKNLINVIDGDKQMALMSLVIHKIFNDVLKQKSKLDFIIIMTQYSNFGAEKFFNKLKIPVVKTPVGVKYTHHEAVKHDIAIYYESNGHGSLIIDQEFVKKCESLFEKDNKEHQLAQKIFKFHNSLTGDAVFNFIQIELFLKYLGITNEDFDNLFIYKPHVTYKLIVGNKNNCESDEWKGKVIKPVVLAQYIDEMEKKFEKAELRIFIRPSGTEDVLRVHLEWSDENNDLLNTEEKIKSLQKTIDAKISSLEELKQFINQIKLPKLIELNVQTFLNQLNQEFLRCHEHWQFRFQNQPYIAVLPLPYVQL